MKCNKKLEFTEISQRITSLRFLLIIFVVFIHNNYTMETVAEYEATGRTLLFVQNEFGRWVQLLFSNGLARCAVPLLFLFSGYFQGLKKENYTVTLKKKCKSLLVPYMFWIVVYGFYYTFGKPLIIHFAPSLVGNHEDIFLSWTAKDWFFKIFGYGTKDGFPGFAYHFWFMRDLIILVLLSPILKLLVRKIPLGFFFFVGTWYLLAPKIIGISNQALFFYVCGLYWGQYKLPMLEYVDKMSWKESITLFLGTFFICYGMSSRNVTLYWLMVMTACILLLKISQVICSDERIYEVAANLSGYSFFLYAVHTPVLNEVLKKIWLRFFPMVNTFFSLFEYFGVTILTVVIGTTLGFFVKKILPRFYSIITGDR